jgi:hypothetical protein
MNIKTARLLLLLFIFVPFSPLAAECPLITYDDLKTKLKGRGETEVIFFASWCASCIPHLKEKHTANTILVVAFDEKLRAEKVLNSFSVGTTCFTSESAAEQLGVRSLPAKVLVKF